MRKFNLVCKCCGGKFEPTREECELWEDGYSPLPRECDDCFNMRESSAPESFQFFDSDSGL